MSDAAFRLTPHDIRGQGFSRVLRGYDPTQVHEFQTRVADAFEDLLRERVQSEERLRNAQEQLKAYRERERALNEALVAAQQLRVDSREQAEREAGMVLREAQAEASRIVENALREEQQIHGRLEGVHHQFAAYLASFRALLERQLAEVNVLETHVQQPALRQGEPAA